MIPVIDLFAGPGGLGEGFSALRSGGKSVFRIVLSIEKDKAARETLRLRSFFRQFGDGAPEDYYQFLRGSISLEELYRRYREESARADTEAWLAELGNARSFPIEQIDDRIAAALDGHDDWVLIGGPPCQAYSVVGRSRMAQEREKYENDQRHFLYREYLRIIAKHRPPVFVMENVKGILSSKVKGSLIIDRILSDLKRPCEIGFDGNTCRGKGSLTYKLYPFSHYGNGRLLFEDDGADPSRFIIQTERHGIPQARHRLIILGIRGDLEVEPGFLPNSSNQVHMWRVIGNLPKIRSRLSNGIDSPEEWINAIKRLAGGGALKGDGIDVDIWRVLQKTARELVALKTGTEFVASDSKPRWQRAWYYDPNLSGVCNHSSRAHMESDLWRYFFAACFASVRGKSPLLKDFPCALLPKHKNANGVEEDEEVAFDDRFRVQVKSRPSTTVTAHIAKDGHYFIHPDPLQCRSLTVREAARLQTFPDNYFFLGYRTEQYQQVGNAVPPLLARRLARVVYQLLR
jgi:DNA (cytosine-5)-methyltransferase 1